MPKKGTKKDLLSKDISLGRVNLTQKAFFAKHLAVMLKAGVPINEALSISEESASGRLKKILGKILESVQSGRPLASSFADFPKVFSGLFVNITRAGETAGTLDENLENIATQLSKEKALLDKIKRAMIYPVVVLIASFFLGMAMAFLVLPKITPLFEGLQVDLPITTRMLIWFSHFIQKYGWYVFTGLILLVGLLLWLIKQKFVKPVTHWLTLHLPLIRRISSHTNIALFCRSLGTLLRSGLPIDQALVVSSDAVSNYYYRTSLVKVSQYITKGTKLSANLAQFEKRFPNLVVRMVKVGEEAGKLEETLLYLADFYEEEVDNSTKALTTVIEPILLLIIGSVVAFLALSIITPIYDITGKIRG